MKHLSTSAHRITTTTITTITTIATPIINNTINYRSNIINNLSPSSSFLFRYPFVAVRHFVKKKHA
jgi:hypothetical protein